MDVVHVIVGVMIIVMIIMPLGLFLIDRVLIEYQISEVYQQCDFALQTLITKLQTNSLSRGEVAISKSILNKHLNGYISEHLNESVSKFEIVDVKFYDQESLPMVFEDIIYDESFVILDANVKIRPSFYRSVIELATGKKYYEIPIRIVKEIPVNI